MTKFELTEPESTESRGIGKERKEEILKKLSPLMLENWRLFWENTKENDSDSDL